MQVTRAAVAARGAVAVAYLDGRLLSALVEQRSAATHLPEATTGFITQYGGGDCVDGRQCRSAAHAPSICLDLHRGVADMKKKMKQKKYLKK